MAQSLAKILIHIIFSTKNRYPFIIPSIEPELYSYIVGILKRNKSPSLKIGGTENHIHILCSLSKNYAVCKIVEEIKTSSSKWIKTKGGDFKKFDWQDGYGAFSVCQSILEDIKKYIAAQKEHHRNISFEEEVKRFLEKYEIEYDEKYLWD